MHMVAQRWNRIDRINYIFGEITRMRGGETHAPNASDLPDGREQLRERHPARWIAIRVYVLPEQLDLGEARVGHPPRLGQDGRRSSAAFLTAGVRHHAVCTELVAAFDDGDVSAMRVCPRRELSVERLLSLPAVQAGDAPFACFQPHQ